MSRRVWSVGLTVCLALSCPVSWAASFDCGKASTAVERAICGDTGLSKLDDTLRSVYGADRSRLPAADVVSLAADQKKWIAGRDRECGPDAKCLSKSYEERIKVLSRLKLNAPYGVLRYRLVEADRQEPIPLITELFEETLKRDGPLRRGIKCETTTEEKVCPGLSSPDARNTVIIEAVGASGFGARYRALLTEDDGGSEHLTNPVVALDFEYTDERVRTPEGVAIADIKVSLTGMAPLPIRLPHVTGLPEATGCFGCP